MDFCLSNLNRWLLIAAVAAVVAFSAHAQQTGRRPGQAIIFSSPDGDEISSNMPSLAAKLPGLLDFANTVQSAAPNFNTPSESEPLPPPQQPALSPAQVQQMRRLLDEQKNWALLTPEQILGLPTQEKILGVPERDAFGQPKNETVVEQFYDRQEQLQARTNNYANYGGADSEPHWGPPDKQELQMNPNILAPAGSRLGNSTLLNQFLNGKPGNGAGQAKIPESGWSKPFSLPAPPPGPTPEEQAAMNQFNQLLQPRGVSVNASKTPALGSPVFSSLSEAPNPAPGQLGVIPIGASFTPLRSGIPTPVGVPAMPGLLGQNNTAVPVLAPEWKPQLPPWMSATPQLGVIPQRKF